VRKGMLIVISAPAGCGKDTILEKVLQVMTELNYSVSATTRPRRVNEIEGKHYFFKSREEFRKMIKHNELLEYTVYCGNFYGTPKAAVEHALNDGKDIVLKIEIAGAAHVKKLFPDCVSVFILPPSLEELRNRLIKRGTEDLETIERRITTAHKEIKHSSGYDYYVINDDLTRAVNEIEGIIDREKRKRENDGG